MSQNNWKIKTDIASETPDSWVFRVILEDPNAHYGFLVTLEKKYHQELTGGNMIPAMLLQQTFLFLLSKEPPEAILSEFNLKDVTTYFSDFEKEMYDVAHGKQS